MVARIWKSSVRRPHADDYAEYVREVAVAGYAATPGNEGVWMLRRNVDDRTEFVVFTLWQSFDAIRAFEGDDDERAVFCPEDERSPSRATSTRSITRSGLGTGPGSRRPASVPASTSS